MSRQADDLRKAMKGFGTDEKALIAVLAPLDPLQAAGVRQAFTQRHRRDLLKDIESETSGYFRDGLMAMARGPLEQDVLNANKAIKGFGTKEAILNDVLLGRSNADMNAIKAHYHHVYKKSLESDVKGDLSLKTERLFDMVLAARRNEESSPVIPQQIEADVSELYRATEGSKIGCDQVAVCAILTQRSDGQLRAISQAYRQKYHRELAEVLKKNFSGHMDDALLYIFSMQRIAPSTTLHYSRPPCRVWEPRTTSSSTGSSESIGTNTACRKLEAPTDTSSSVTWLNAYVEKQEATTRS